MLVGKVKFRGECRDVDMERQSRASRGQERTLIKIADFTWLLSQEAEVLVQRPNLSGPAFSSVKCIDANACSVGGL